jgi:hypothetical protein
MPRRALAPLTTRANTGRRERQASPTLVVMQLGGESTIAAEKLRSIPTANKTIVGDRKRDAQLCDDLVLGREVRVCRRYGL